VSDRSVSPPLVVACLCAQWCSSCREYRATFDEVARRFPDARFLWIDIEDDAALVDDVEVETFPTLLIAAGGAPRFLGPVAPHAESLVALVRAHAGNTVRALSDTRVQALVARLGAPRGA
jgi:thioredoxin 1